MIRKIIKINEEKCNGCGACAKACHEGAIEMIDGKAKLTRENYCDGLGDCLPACPTDAISFEEREVLLQAIRSLGDPDEKILIWKFYYGYPTRKIAEVLGLKENTVDQKVKRGLEKVKKTLEGGGFHEG